MRFWEVSHVLGSGLLTTILALHGQLPQVLTHASIMAIGVPVDSTRVFQGAGRPIDWIRLGVVACATTILCLHGSLPPSFAVEAVGALAVPWRRGGQTP